jgi:hypothetical protein
MKNIESGDIIRIHYTTPHEFKSSDVTVYLSNGQLYILDNFPVIDLSDFEKVGSKYESPQI